MKSILNDGVSLRFELRQLAIALIITGAALGMYLNFFVDNLGWNNIIIVFSMIFLPNWTQLKSFKLPSVDINFVILLFFQCLCVFYLSLSELPTGLSRGQLYIFHLFVVAFIISVMSLKSIDINFNIIIKYSWLLTFICTILCFVCCVSGIYYIEEAKVHNGTGDESVLSPLTMTGACVTNILCCLFVKSERKSVIWARFISVILSVICLFLVGKRTPLLVSILIVMIYAWRTSKFKLRIKKKYVIYLFLSIVCICLLFSDDTIRDTVYYLFERSFDGIHDMIYGTSKSGDAAVMRFRARQWTYDLIETKFDLFNYIFGYGYMTRWLDNPVLQAYLDMGLIGFFVYFGYVIVYPIIILFSKISRNRFVLFISLLGCYNIFSAFNSGHPYVYTKWWTVIILIFVVKYCYAQYGKTDYYL